MQLTEARKILCKPEDPLPISRQTAKTYELVWNTKQMVNKVRPSLEKPMKDAALVVREVLVLQVCTYARTPAARREAVIHALETRGTMPWWS